MCTLVSKVHVLVLAPREARSCIFHPANTSKGVSCLGLPSQFSPASVAALPQPQLSPLPLPSQHLPRGRQTDDAIAAAVSAMLGAPVKQVGVGSEVVLVVHATMHSPH